MKAQPILIGVSMIIVIMLLVSPLWVQAHSQPLRSAPSTLNRSPVNVTTTPLTVTLPGRLDQKDYAAAPAGGGGGDSLYPKFWHRLTENEVGDHAPVTAFNPKRNEYLVVWAECPTTDLCHVIGRRTTSDGTPLGDPLTISSGHKDMALAVGYNSYHGEYLVTYARYFTATNGSDLYGRIILGNGELWGSELTLDTSDGFQTFPAVAFNPGAINHGHPGEYLVVYQSAGNIVAKHVGAYGDVDADPHLIGVFPDLLRPDVAYNSARNEYLVAYAQLISNTGTLHDQDIYARRVSADGFLLGSPIYVAVGSTLDATSPRVAVGADTYFVAYTLGPTDQFNAETIGATWLSGDGNPLVYYPTPLAEPPAVSLVMPAVAYTGQGFLVTWQGYAAGTTNIYGRYACLTPGFWSNVFTIDDAAYDQFNGDVACATGSCLIVNGDNWYESGHDDEITAWHIWLQKVHLPLVLK